MSILTFQGLLGHGKNAVLDLDHFPSIYSHNQELHNGGNNCNGVHLGADAPAWFSPSLSTMAVAICRLSTLHGQM